MKTEHLKITGMTCGGCTSSVGHALKAVNGVNDVQVSLATGEATVQFDERLTSPEQLKLEVQRAGYGIDTMNLSHAPKGKGGCCG